MSHVYLVLQQGRQEALVSPTLDSDAVTSWTLSLRTGRTQSPRTQAIISNTLKVCASAHTCLHRFVRLSVWPSVRASVCPCVCACASAHPRACLCIRPCLRPSVCPSDRPSVCLPAACLPKKSATARIARARQASASTPWPGRLLRQWPARRPRLHTWSCASSRSMSVARVLGVSTSDFRGVGRGA